MTTALILVDLQNDYFPGGRNELEGSLEASLCAQQLLNYFRQVHWPLVHIQHVSTRPGATFFLPGTPGVETHENVRPLEGEVVFQKHYPNSFRETSLLERLKRQRVTRLVISGMMTHMCVDATTRAAFDLGFECLIAADACATKALTFEDQRIPAQQVHGSFLAALNGTYGQVLSVAALLGQLRA